MSEADLLTRGLRRRSYYRPHTPTIAVQPDVYNILSAGSGCEVGWVGGVLCFRGSQLLCDDGGLSYEELMAWESGVLSHEMLAQEVGR